HLAEFHISHDVVDAQNATIVPGEWRCHEPWQKRPFVILIRDQRVDRIAISADRGPANGAMFIPHVMRFLGWLRPAPEGFGKRLIRVIHFQCDITYAIAMLADVIRGQVVGRQRCSQDEVRLALTHRIRSALALAGLQSAVSDLGKAESFAVKVSRLPGVADKEFDVMNAFQPEWILHRIPPTLTFYILSLIRRAGAFHRDDCSTISRCASWP